MLKVGVGMEVQLRKADLKRALKVLKELGAKMAKIEAGEDGDLLVRAWGVKDNYVALSAPAYVGRVGSAVVDVKMFENAVNSAGKDISLLVNDDEVRVYSINERREFVIPQQHWFEFPELSPVFTVRTDGKVLKTAILKTYFAMSKEDDIYPSGLYIAKREDQVHFVATDGYRLSFVWDSMEWEHEVLISRWGILGLRRFLENAEYDEVDVGVGGGYIYMKFGSNIFGLKLMDFKFPDYMAFIPTSYLYKFEVNRKELLDALKALARGRKDKVVPVKFKFTWDDTLELITEDKRGYACLKALCYGDNFPVWLNAQLLVDALEAFDCRRLTFLLTAKDGVVEVADADNEERMIYLTMPMNIKE